MTEPTFRQRCACSAEADGAPALVRAWWADHREWCSWAAEYQRWRDKRLADDTRLAASARGETVLR